MKIKLLIVDDERHIRLGLQRTIDWARIGISEVFAASNAHEGMTLFYRHRPQIVLMDLMLPGMDGMQACERIKREDKSVRIFVLTAHLKTEYVRRCLSLGIEEYFVKPAPIDEMVDRIGMAVTEIIEQSFKDGNSEESELERSRRMLTLMLQSSEEPPLTQLALLGLNCPGTSKRMVAVEIFASYEETMRVCSSIQWQTSQQKVYCVPTLMQMEGRSVYVMLLEYTDLAWAEFLRSLYGVIVNHYSEDGAVTVNIAVGAQRADWAIPAMWERLKQVMKKFFFIGANSLVEEERLGPPEGRIAVPSGDELRTIVNSVHPDEMLERLEDLFDGFSKGGDEAVAQTYSVAAELLLMIVNRYNTDARDEFYERFLCRLFDDSVCYLQQLQDLVISAWEDMQKQAEEIPEVVRRITRYVQENYHRDFEVAKLAEYVGLSKNYVSHIFNRTCGKSITQYLNEVRIEQAKRLLDQEELSLQDISSKVGYNNYTYFTKIFRQIVGVTPSAYRMEQLSSS